MNELILDEIKRKAEEIMEITYPFCEDDELDVSLRNTKINNLAHDIAELTRKLN